MRAPLARAIGFTSAFATRSLSISYVVSSIFLTPESMEAWSSSFGSSLLGSATATATGGAGAAPSSITRSVWPLFSKSTNLNLTAVTLPEAPGTLSPTE